MDKQSVRAGGIGSAPEVSWPIRSGQLPVVTEYLSSRPETGYGLDLIPAELPHGALAGLPGMTVLVGPSGYGKTYLAGALAAGAARSGSYDLQLWVNASSPSAVVSGYAAAAADVGLADRGARAGSAAEHFLDWMGQTERNWLVVLDNVTDPSGLQGLWPAGAGGQVLITCHQSADLSELARAKPRICEIGEFSPREALAYLTARLYEDADKRVEAVDLAADLSYMPFALGLAAATMTATSLDCRHYRLMFAGRREELAGRTADGVVYPADVAWSLALELADQRSPAGLARSALTLAALLDPAGMPARVASSGASLAYMSRYGHGMAIDERHVLAAYGNLARAGLVSVGRSAGFDLVAVHPVVSETVRRLMPASLLDAAARAAADALVEVWPEPGAAPELEQALRGCAGWLGGIAGDLLWLPEPHPVLLRAGTSLTDAGLAGPAIAYWTSMAAASGRALGADHPQTVAIHDLLADACESAGRPEDALEVIRVGVAERERALGRDHPDTLAARAHLARMYQSAGQFDAAVDAYERLIADREWALGAVHPDTMASRSQLARTYLVAGQFDQAIACYQRNAADWERALGPEHREVLTEYLNLGSAYQSAGQVDDAIAVFGRVRAVAEKSVGQDHPLTATAASYLAFACRKAGRMKEAISLYRQALATREAVLGAEHPDTLTAMANLASCFHSAGRMKDALPVYERLLAASERVYGRDHRDTLTAQGNLAGAYHSAGRLSDALPAYERTLADFERVLGADHPDTLTSRANLANAYYMARRQSDAIALFKRTIADCERALGPDHPLTRTIADNLDTLMRLSQVG
jgi:tetratricopeptide (TPR) repeat protein